MAERSPPHRGDVWLTAFDTAAGGEIQKTRPVAVLGNDAANAFVVRLQLDL